MNVRNLVVSRFKELSRHRAFVPVLVFVGLVVLLFISSRFTDRPPSIERISPDVGYPGMVMLINGSNFGDVRGDGEVVFSGIRPPTSAYLEWTNRRISVRIPQNADSGFVVVAKHGERSNPALFTNQNSLPVLVSATTQPGSPQIQAITPAGGAVGTLITIRGKNFGPARGQNEVYFTPVSSSDDQTGLKLPDGTVRSPERRFAGCECDQDYVNWSDQSITMYVPDGASSGNVTVTTSRGTSNAAYFEVADDVGSKLYRDKRGYQINYGMQISNVVATPNGSIDVWMPGLSEDLSQRDIEAVLDPKPVWDDIHGLLRYHFADFDPAATYSIDVTYYFDRFAVETRINPSKVPATYDTRRELYKVYTSPDALVPAGDPAIVRAANSIVGSDSNPYYKALDIYHYLTDRMQYSADATTGSATDSLSAGAGDAYDFSILFTALARSVGVPARPVAGTFVYGDRQTTRHYWAEFYLTDFGWVPVDPVLGSGVKFGDSPNVPDPRSYYFGNIDNQHIAFSRGVITVEPLDPQGKSVRKDRMFSLQTIHEEASSGVTSYTSFWRDVKIVDWW